MPHGEMSARTARGLAKHVPDPRFEVLFDHRDITLDPPERVGNISSWFGELYCLKSQLAHLDIAVVDRPSNRAIVLVEIEETTSGPKVAIGDAFGTILGDHITFQGTRDLSLGSFTALLILLRDGHPGHLERIQCLQKQIVGLAGRAPTGNSAIGQIALRLFRTEDELLEKLSGFAGSCLIRYLDSP